MASERHIFSLSGPKHLTHVDWTNAYHRRSVAASLVQGVSIQERDRLENRHGPQALAPPWWDFFNFRLNCVLRDEDDESIFCAIYEFKYPAPAENVPKYVIAFRGTMRKLDTILEDLMVNLRCFFNKLHRSPRFGLAMNSVQTVVALAGAGNVWLAGHSMGSAMALLAGKNMTMAGNFLETYLFNPPFLSVPMEWITDERLKHGIRFASSFLKAGLTLTVKGCQHHKPQEHDPFVVFSQWIPYLFVNPSDHLCSEYIGYFEHRKKMEAIGAGKIERLATKNSMRCLLSGALGEDSEALHLLPSAYLTINLGPSPDFKRAHGLHQWWNPNFQCQSMLYQYRLH